MLALQGDFREHAEALGALGADCREVRRPADLVGVEAIVLPGGESTAIGRLLRTSELLEPLVERLSDGLPVLATCAGLILLAGEVLDGKAGQTTLGTLDLAVRRNAYGRQRESFEAPLRITGLPGGLYPGVFIRAPTIERVGEGVEVLSVLGGRAVAVRQGPVTALTFHPELSGDLRLHERFLSEVGG